MVGVENTGVSECVDHSRLTRICCNATIRAGAPVVGRIHELNFPARAVGRDMERDAIGQGHVAIAGHSGDRRRVDRHINARHSEWRRR